LIGKFLAPNSWFLTLRKNKQMKEAIILAGGFGTRLKHIVNDVPKPMAPVNGAPFLSWLFQRLQQAGVGHVILSTGYMHEKIEKFYGNRFENIKLTYSRETSPLGTGGAILLGITKAQADDVFVLNGDTLFDVDFDALTQYHSEKQAVLTVALRQVEDVSRYGAVGISAEGKIISFKEKKQAEGKGLINGGIYLLNKKWFETLNLPEQFSFEKEILETIYPDNEFYGLGFDSYFIDIGVPEDFYRAQDEFKDFEIKK
jgi:D-glycero-alpha-D-manno-heptose 1-phosphate guanylyltransferase